MVIIDHTHFSSLFSMTPELPIDIVYTWVNGSDPILIKKLKRLKQELLLKQNRCVYIYLRNTMYVCMYVCMYVICM